MEQTIKGKANKSAVDMSIAELIAAGFRARVVCVVAKNDDDAASRQQMVGSFLGRAIGPVAKKEFADVEFSRESRRGRLIKTTRSVPVGMVPRGLIASYQASVHGNSCQRKKPGIRTRFM